MNFPSFPEFKFSDFPIYATKFMKVIDEVTNEPHSEVKVTEDKAEITLALPGVKKDEVNMETLNNILTIKVTPKEGFFQKTYGKFEKSYNIDGFNENVKANLSDGILTITLEKLKKSKTSAKKIEIK